jgi:hypothetical protein
VLTAEGRFPLKKEKKVQRESLHNGMAGTLKQYRKGKFLR